MAVADEDLQVRVVEVADVPGDDFEEAQGGRAGLRPDQRSRAGVTSVERVEQVAAKRAAVNAGSRRVAVVAWTRWRGARSSLPGSSTSTWDLPQEKMTPASTWSIRAAAMPGTMRSSASSVSLVTTSACGIGGRPSQASFQSGGGVRTSDQPWRQAGYQLR